MDRTAGDGGGVLVNVALVWPGFRGWGLARPGVDAATEKLRRAAEPGVRFDAWAASGAADAPAALNSCRALVKRDGRAPGAASRFQRTSERRGDRSMSARLRVPHDGAGRHPSASATTKVLVGRVAGSRSGSGCGRSHRAKALSRQCGVMS